MEKNIEQLQQFKIVEPLIRFSEDIEKFGGVQKFVLLKNNDNFYFASLPEKEAPNHLDIIDVLKNERNIETPEILGGGSLTLFGNEIKLIDTSRSTVIGPVKIGWGNLREMLQKAVGDKYEIVLPD